MSEYYPPISYTVPPSEDGWLLKTILQKRLHVSRKLQSRLKLTEQGITVNGQRVYISVRVRDGDVVEIRMEKEISDDILPEPIPFRILYEDEHLLIVNKEAGIIVHPTHGHYTGTLANGVVHYWRDKGEAFRFRAVHRLDQETSGVIAIAKNPYVHQHISEQMIANEVDKRYLALVHGVPSPEEGEMDGPIDRDPEEPHRRIVTPDGYPSLTRYKVVEAYGSSSSLVQLKLETGRTHQIRVHMTSIGCPLIGDKLYRHPVYRKLPPEEEWTAESVLQEGFTPSEQTAVLLDHSISRQALHAWELSFQHPVTRERMTFQAPLPPDMTRLITEAKQHDLDQ
ncbi:23S rRNA pseudouridine1911/1915/1917 synthase [Paenibacillus rhizosphaerae]|uniref:Pseudouridine synthase n=1 Tax=Paenibacillus rhizosphaerae TaxID=297318 RepID=A0A839TRG4_9BACL|nr:RluA family pseudouridine synthase [Paenibacillus rhizosphaerae]MBB3129322.1 23S rRNA pseudouridine1911/1915/1917 synthase [Paenibacillus rhizosphaerae]